MRLCVVCDYLDSSECRETNCDDADADASPTTRARRKRMRSSFKQQQLKVMKAYFGLNQNPDSKELKDIAARTGLLTRVIQVRSKK